MFNILKYIFQGVAHYIVLWLEFIDFNLLFGYLILALILIIMYRQVKGCLLDIVRAFMGLLKIPIVNMFVCIWITLNIMITIKFGDEISFNFALILFIGGIKDLFQFIDDSNKEISFTSIREKSIAVMKSMIILFLCRIVYMIDSWDFSTLDNYIIYIVFAIVTMCLVVVKDIYFCIERIKVRATIKHGEKKLMPLIVLYFYSTFKLKDLKESEKQLISYYDNQRKVDFIKFDTHFELYRPKLIINDYKQFLKQKREGEWC